MREAEESANRVLSTSDEQPSSQLTLHAAIAKVLSAHGKPMRSGEIRDAVNAKSLYVRRDGQPVRTTQVAARVRNYTRQFRILGDGQIWFVDDGEEAQR